MKLIDILVQELPKRGGWPDDVNFVEQSNGGMLFDVVDMSKDYLFRMHEFEIADDWYTSTITREQYEAALAGSKEMIINKPDSDGWISWDGGECPVDGDVVVDVKFRAQGQADLDGDVADNFRWEHFSNGADVVAYRLHKSEHQKPQWDGEGLPPVGTVCEIAASTPQLHINHPEGSVVKIYAHFTDDRGIELAAFVDEIGKVGGVCTYKCFRPLKTQEDKKRDEVIEALKEGLGHAHGLFDLMQIYHLLKDGKIPHIRID